MWLYLMHVRIFILPLTASTPFAEKSMESGDPAPLESRSAVEQAKKFGYETFISAVVRFPLSALDLATTLRMWLEMHYVSYLCCGDA